MARSVGSHLPSSQQKVVEGSPFCRRVLLPCHSEREGKIFADSLPRYIQADGAACSAQWVQFCPSRSSFVSHGPNRSTSVVQQNDLRTQQTPTPHASTLQTAESCPHSFGRIAGWSMCWGRPASFLQFGPKAACAIQSNWNSKEHREGSGASGCQCTWASQRAHSDVSKRHRLPQGNTSRFFAAWTA